MFDRPFPTAKARRLADPARRLVNPVCWLAATALWSGLAAPAAAQEAADAEAPASPTVVIRVDEGSVEVINERQGLRMFLDEGFRTTLRGRLGGELEIFADPWNPGDLVVQGAGRVNIAPGSTVEAATGPEGLEARTTAGVAVLTTPEGERRPLVSSTPPAAPTAAPSPSATAEVSIEVDEGQVQVTNRQQAVAMTLDEGFAVSLTGSAGGDLEIVAEFSNPGELVVEGKGAVAIAPGSAVEAASAPGGLEAEVVTGSATLTAPDGTSKEVPFKGGAQVFVFANSQAEAAGDAPVSLSVEEGRIEVFNADHGVSFGLDEGFGVTLASTAGGDIQIVTDPDNPGALTISQGGETASVEAGSTVATSSSRQRLDATAVSGSGGGDTGGDTGGDDDDGGDDFFNQTLPPMACGECGISDGFGGCIDVNSLCPDESCLIGRTCSNGQCVGGRVPASGEVPGCP